MNKIAYNPCLDGLRALAALTVALYHAKVPGLPGGFFGVDVFFVLSGYLITRLLLAEYRFSGAVDIWRFTGRRLRRLYPALLLMLLVYLLLAPWAFPVVAWKKHFQDAMWTGVYLVNYVRFWDMPISRLGHVWSLAVEMQFYLLWPLLFLLLIRLPRHFLLLALVCLYVAATLWRWWRFDHIEGSLWLIYTAADTRCSGLLLGCLLACWNPGALRRYWALPAFAVLFFAVTFFSWPWVVTARFGFTVVEWCAAALILAQPSWLGWRPLAWFGRISYGFYLWHYLVMRVLREWEWPWQSVLLVGIVLGLVLAVLSYYLVERRFHKPRFAG